MPEKLAVFVEHFLYPPTERFVAAIQAILRDNYGQHEAHVTSGRNAHDHVRDVAWCARYGMEKAEGLIRTMPGTMLAASVVPLQLEFQSGKKPIRQNMIFVSARNLRGNEWLYAHYVGKIKTPVEVTNHLAASINEVLEERGTLETTPAESDVVRVATFIDAIMTSVVHVLKSGSAHLSS